MFYSVVFINVDKGGAEAMCQLNNNEYYFSYGEHENRTHRDVNKGENDQLFNNKTFVRIYWFLYETVCEEIDWTILTTHWIPMHMRIVTSTRNNKHLKLSLQFDHNVINFLDLKISNDKHGNLHTII